jgi:ribonuclease BN (tRNA processing enzyme)
VRDGDAHVLLDIGGGVLGNLIRHVPYGELDALFLSHLHFDHCLDIFPMLLVRSGCDRLPVYGPPGTRETLEALFPLFSAKPQLYAGAMEVTEYVAGQDYEIGPMTVTPVEVVHDVPSFALVVQGSGRVAYSSDTALCPGVVRAAESADIFVCEATFQSGMKGAKGREIHMDSAEAGQVARDAMCKRLLLTHIRYDLDPGASEGEARDLYDGPVEAATINKVYRT